MPELQKPLITVIWEAVPGSPPVPFHTFQKTVLQDLPPPTCRLSGFILNKHALPVRRLGRKFLAIHLCCCCMDVVILSGQRADFGCLSWVPAWQQTPAHDSSLHTNPNNCIALPLHCLFCFSTGFTVGIKLEWRRAYEWSQKGTKQVKETRLTIK